MCVRVCVRVCMTVCKETHDTFMIMTESHAGCGLVSKYE